MKTAAKVLMVFLGGAVALVASQEAPRAYVSNCICCAMRYLFGS